MTWEQYWYGDVWMIVAYREADQRRMERINAEAHLMGLYVYEALCDVSPVLHAFAKKGTRPQKYRTEPYALFEKETGIDGDCDSSERENSRIFAKAYMKQMLRAGKNWGKRGGSDGR